MLKKDLAESQQLENLKGKRLGPYMSHNPVSATQIWQWCCAMGDKNPSYRLGQEQIAPAAMMQMWTMRDINDRYAAGSTDAPPYQIFDSLRDMGYSSNVAVSYDITFHCHLHIGDRAKHFTSVVAISDKKLTAIGQGFFVTERVEYFTLDENLFAEARITYFQYQAAEITEAETSMETERHSEQPEADPLPQQEIAGQADGKDLDVAALSVGDQLPEVAIPITHKLIVGGAIATQDFVSVHHSVLAAQAAGMPDIFMNILTTSGLSARYLTDWAGPKSRLKKLKFDLRAPNLPGDVMIMEGEIGDIASQDADDLISVTFSGKNSIGVHVSGSATLALSGQKTS